MRILYCIPSLSNPGGMERVLTEKVNYLSSLDNYEIYIVTTDQMGEPIRFALDERVKLYHLDLDFDSHFDEKLIRKYILHQEKIATYKSKLSSIINELNIDICVSLCGKEIDFLYSLPVKCKKIAEIHFAMNFRRQFITSRKKGLIWQWFGTIRTYQLKRSVNKLDKLVVLTNNDKIQWERTHSNIMHIPNPNPFSNPELSNLGNKSVISVGKLDAQKGYDMLVEAWAIVSEKHSDWNLDIFGQGEWEIKLNRRIEELGLVNTIRLRGLTANVQSEYIQSSIYVMSSRYEGLPMVLIEAMSCGLPVVSFDCEYGPSEIISNGIDGFLVESNNIEQLADKICVLIENDTLRKEMGKNALSSVKRFDKDNVMIRWVNLFESIVSI